jgi:hypothetical protein
VAGRCRHILNAAERSGAKVSQEVLEKDKQGNLAGLDVAKGAFTSPASPAAEPSSAGISLYRETAKLGGLWEKQQTNQQLRQTAEKTLADTQAPAPKKAEARQQLESIIQDEKAAQAATKAVASNIGNSKWVAGFGNNGGEEFLSYLNLTESLRQQGGKEWDEWRFKMKTTICGTQNEDGSSGAHHCITGRTFCTSTALLALLAEKTPASAKVTSVQPAEATSATNDKAAVTE